MESLLWAVGGLAVILLALGQGLPWMLKKAVPVTPESGGVIKAGEVNLDRKERFNRLLQLEALLTEFAVDDSLRQQVIEPLALQLFPQAIVKVAKKG